MIQLSFFLAATTGGPLSRLSPGLLRSMRKVSSSSSGPPEPQELYPELGEVVLSSDDGLSTMASVVTRVEDDCPSVAAFLPMGSFLLPLPVSPLRLPLASLRLPLASLLLPLPSLRLLLVSLVLPLPSLLLPLPSLLLPLLASLLPLLASLFLVLLFPPLS